MYNRFIDWLIRHIGPAPIYNNSVPPQPEVAPTEYGIYMWFEELDMACNILILRANILANVRLKRVSVL